MAVELTRVSRLYVEIDVAATLPGGGSATISGVDVALLPVGSGPDASTAWSAATYATGTATVLLAGPDAGGSGAIVVPSDADLWAKVTDSPEIDAAKVTRVSVKGGTVAVIPVATVTDAYVAGLVTGDTATHDALDAEYVNTVTQAQQWTSNPDATKAFTATTPPPFGTVGTVTPLDVIVDAGELGQQFYGTGAALTDASAWLLLTKLTTAQRHNLLTELFGPDQGNMGWVRISFAGQEFQSDTVNKPVSYDDLTTGTDPNLTGFSVQMDTARVIPVLQEILAINPRVRVIASMWTPPNWMLPNPAATWSQTNQITSTYFDAWALYVLKSVQAFQSYGIPIWATSVANEPFVASKVASTDLQTVIKKTRVLFDNAGINTRILAADDNWYQITRLQNTLADPATAQAVGVIGWHCYSASPTNMELIRRAYPTIPQITTEFRSLSTESLDYDLREMVAMTVGSVRAGSSGVVIWNLALDETGEPNYHLTLIRRGVVTIPSDGSGNIVRNPEYYALTHLSKFVKPGARRIASSSYGPPYVVYTTLPSTLITTAFLNPDGSRVLYAYNGAAAAITFQIIDAATGDGFPVTMGAGELSTFVWGTPAYRAPAGTPVTIPAPATPTLTATGGQGQIDLVWSGDATVTGWTLTRGNSAGTETSIASLPASTTSYSDYLTGTKFYKVVATGLGGTATSPERSATATAPAVPGTPVLLSALGNATGVVLTWTAPAANGAPITSYNILRGTTPGGETLLTTSPPGTSYTDSTVTGITQYYYKVAATNSVGTGASSNEVASVLTTPIVEATSSFTSGANANSHTWNHTVGAGAQHLLVAFGAGPGGATSVLPTVTGVTFGGVALTRLAGAVGEPGPTYDTSNNTAELWTLAAPTAGVGAIVVTFTTGQSVAFFGGALSVAGVATSSPFGTPVTVGGQNLKTLTMTVTGGQVNDLVLALASMKSGTITPGAGQTAQWNLTLGSQRGVATIQTGGIDDITSTFTSSGSADKTAGIAMAIHPHG
jgi:glucosylceramidase